MFLETKALTLSFNFLLRLLSIENVWGRRRTINRRLASNQFWLFQLLQKEFLDKYDSFAQLVAKIYPTESIPSVTEMRDLLASM